MDSLSCLQSWNIHPDILLKQAIMDICCEEFNRTRNLTNYSGNSIQIPIATLKEASFECTLFKRTAFFVASYYLIIKVMNPYGQNIVELAALPVPNELLHILNSPSYYDTRQDDNMSSKVLIEILTYYIDKSTSDYKQKLLAAAVAPQRILNKYWNLQT